MKKKIIFAILSMFYTIIFSTSVFATDLQSVQTSEDGFIVETIIEDESDPSFFSTSTVKKKKTTTYKNSSGSILWSVTVHGTFTYNGSSAKCISSSVSTTCPNTNWKISSKSASKSGATASATASAKQYQNHLYLKTITKTVKLTCSKTGKFS